MNVKDLKELLRYADDDLEVVIPLNQIFDGVFYSPNIEESGVTEMGGDDIPDEQMFLLAPAGFSDEPDTTFEQN